MRGPTRREILLAGAAGAGALAVPGLAEAAGGSSGLVGASAGAGANAADTDADRLRRLIEIELLLLFCYRHVLASSLLSPRAHSALQTFPAHEEAHIRALARRLRARGGQPPAPPASVSEANHDLAHRKIGGRLGQLRGGPDALRLLLTLEQVTVGAYFVALTKLYDAQLVELASEIMATDAQHDAVVSLVMPKATPASAVPYGLVQGLQ